MLRNEHQSWLQRIEAAVSELQRRHRALPREALPPLQRDRLATLEGRRETLLAELEALSHDYGDLPRVEDPEYADLEALGDRALGALAGEGEQQARLRDAEAALRTLARDALELEWTPAATATLRQIAANADEANQVLGATQR